MKLIKLEILNLASLDRQGGEVINFEEGALGESTIFSIVGPTGSGKSTILDAICLALYNRAPRYPRKKGERSTIAIFGEPDENERNRLSPTDCRNILTRGKKEGYSKLTFLANNGTVYRAEWHIRFKTKKYDDATTLLYQLSHTANQLKETPAEWASLPDIIGLDYDQFLRTVLIAQGAFANFLTAKEDERFILLEKLIGCETTYTDIAARIKEASDTATSQYNEIAACFAALEQDLLPAEEQERLEKRIAELEAEDMRVKAELTKTAEQLRWFAQEEQMLQNLKALEAALAEAQAGLEAFKKEAERLKLHDATLPAVACFRDIRKAEEHIGQLNEQLRLLADKAEGMKKKIAENSDALDNCRKAQQDAERELERLRPHINRARSIGGELKAALLTLADKSQDKKKAEEALATARKAVGDNSAAIKKAEETLKEARTAHDSLEQSIKKGKEDRAAAANEAGAAYAATAEKAKGLDAAQLQEADRSAQQQKSDLKEAVAICMAIKEATAAIEKNSTENDRLACRNRAIDQELASHDTEALRKELETLQKTYTLMTSENWQQHRTTLKEGQPCPLCGATHHPYSCNEAYAPVAGDMLKLIQEKEHRLKELTDAERELTKEKSKNCGTVSALESNTTELKKKLESLQLGWDGILKRHPDWPDDSEQLDGLRQHYEQKAEQARLTLNSYNALALDMQRLHKAKDDAEKDLREYQDRADKQLRKAEERLNGISTMLQAEQAKTANLKAQLAEKQEALAIAGKAQEQARADVEDKKKAIKDEIGDKDPEALEQMLNKALTEASKAVEQQTGVVFQLKRELTGISTQAETARETKKKEEDLLASKLPQLADWISDYNAAHSEERALTTHDIAQINTAAEDWEDIRYRLKTRADAETAARATLKNAQDSHQRHQETRPEQDKDCLTARKAELEQHDNAELIACKARKSRHEDAKKKTGTLFEKRQAAELKKKEWKEIAEAIGSDGKTLRQIAQCYTLRFLIAHANAEIRKFNSRYELQQVKNSLAIRVIDHDRADDIRDTTSLSGGETFIVSLGLALGLSSLSSKNISFDNLFIDEGFGTLDPDTLAIVIDSLAMLQSSQGKKVGVISHTDTMSERITTQIRVRKAGGAGSSYIEIYP